MYNVSGVYVSDSVPYSVPFRIPSRSVPLSSKTPIPFRSFGPFRSGTRSVYSVPFRHVGIFRREAHRWVRLTSGNIFL